jgi:hypothetical protein
VQVADANASLPATVNCKGWVVGTVGAKPEFLAGDCGERGTSPTWEAVMQDLAGSGGIRFTYAR